MQPLKRIGSKIIPRTCVSGSIVNRCATRNNISSSLSSSSSYNQHNNNVVCVRSFGVFSSISDKIGSAKDKYMENKKTKQFTEQIDQILNIPVFSFKYFKEMMEKQAKSAGVTGWKSVFKGQSADKEMLTVQLKILEHFEPTEQVSLQLGELTSEEKKRISKASGVPSPLLKGLIKQYIVMERMHRWLVARKNSGKPIPTSQESLMETMGAEPMKYTYKDKQLQKKYFMGKQRSQYRGL